MRTILERPPVEVREDQLFIDDGAASSGSRLYSLREIRSCRDPLALLALNTCAGSSSITATRCPRRCSENTMRPPSTCAAAADGKSRSYPKNRRLSCTQASQSSSREWFGSYLVENTSATSKCERKSAADRTCSKEKSSMRTTCNGRVV